MLLEVEVRVGDTRNFPVHTFSMMLQCLLSVKRRIRVSKKMSTHLLNMSAVHATRRTRALAYVMRPRREVTQDHYSKNA